MWKATLLSRVEKLTLINSSMNSIASYYMQATQLPKSTLVELDRICNNDFTGMMGQTHSFLLKHKGGIEIRSHVDLNHAMLVKLGWKMLEGENNLAKECITSKYVRERSNVTFIRKVRRFGIKLAVYFLLYTRARCGS